MLNPAFVDEQLGLDGDASHVAVSPYNRAIDPATNGVDWDYSNTWTPGSWGASRGPVTYTTGSAYALAQKEQNVMLEKDLDATTPALVRGPDNRMYMFYVENGRIKTRHAQMDGLPYRGSCPGDDTLGGPHCTTWSAATEVPTIYGARGVTALWHDGQMLLAFRTHVDSLRTIRATGADAAGTLTGWTDERYRSAWTDKEPEVELIRVDPANFGGDDLVVAIFYRNKANGQYQWVTMADMDSIGSTAQGALVTDAGSTIYGTQSPTFTSVPYDPATSDAARPCGAITNTLGQVQMYCYDRAADHFEHYPGAFASAPVSIGKPGLAFHAYRSWYGTPYAGDETRGALWLAAAAQGSSGHPWDFVKMWISEPISEDPIEDLANLHFPATASGMVGNQWSDMPPGAGLALYDEPGLGSMKGLWIRDRGSNNDTDRDRNLYFLPFADGTYRTALRDGNDFQVLEKGICQSIQGAAACGPSSFGLD